MILNLKTVDDELMSECTQKDFAFDLTDGDHDSQHQHQQKIIYIFLITLRENILNL